MGGERAAGGRIRAGVRRWRRGAGLFAAGLVVAGCAAMPGDGPVQRVETSERSDNDTQGVRVWAVPPEDDDSPTQIVRGFLEAITSDDPDFETAKEYLTPERREEWEPFAGTSVLSAGPQVTPVTDSPVESGEHGVDAAQDDTQRITLSGTRMASVDESRVYAPRSGDYEATLLLRRTDGQWRIDDLPDGLVMGDADFSRIYRSVNTFYYADLGAESGRVEQGGDVLVADPVVVRRRIEPVSDAIEALLDGPSEWLDPVVGSAFPPGARMVGDGARVDDSQRLTLWLAGIPADWPPSRCEEMAAQLLHTVRDVRDSTSVEVSEARLLTESGGRLCSLSESGAEQHAPGLLDGDTERPYFLDAEHRLVSVADDGTARPVQGVLGRSDAENPGLRSVAIDRTRAYAAGVSTDGQRLYTAPLTGGEGVTEVYAGATAGEDAGLSAPSWDGLGDLWVADRNPDDPALLRLTGGRGEAVEIPVDGLRSGQRIEAVRVASDGVRIAMLISGPDEEETLQLGRIERAEGADGVEVAVSDLRPVAPQLVDVAAVSWAGDSRLVVVGRPSDGVEQLLYVQTDGSMVNTPSVPGLNDATGVAAAEEESEPLLAETAGGIAWLADGTQWKKIDGGSAPVYPG
ncbi:LpqB family beta-propeller domain-containing protein [Streptomyces sp. RFCAC02]|uniref:LpqB family beta-propeller domain-containing protein n=1 Tax=Streptomyces sp. RFCAC02 TaxID=2499143 RepID=UPI00102089E3|nr:LpqB family beta-propeller domain-containing protein [Streptomyces sp. RFCAC02]